MLLKDSSTYTYAKIRKWDYPASREWFALADLWDLTLSANVKKKDFKPYPRPYKQEDNNKKQIGDVSTLTQAEVRQRLALMNPKEN